MFVPADALASAEGIHQPWLHTDGRHGCLEAADHEKRTALVGEQERLLRRQAVAAGQWIKVDVAARCLRVQPLAYVALAGTRGGGQLGRCQTAVAGEGLVQAKTIAQDDQGGVIGGAKIIDGPTHEVVQSLVVDHEVLLLV